MTMSMKATTKKRKPVIPDGITYKKTKGGINVRVANNGRIISVLRGYNNTQNVQKGLMALTHALNYAYNAASGKFNMSDATPKKKVKKK